MSPELYIDFVKAGYRRSKTISAPKVELSDGGTDSRRARQPSLMTSVSCCERPKEKVRCESSDENVSGHAVSAAACPHD